jgi:uncharacterized protein YdeI (YjbR/CyaY-like superfamily)
MGQKELNGLAIVAFPTRGAWSRWLAAHHASSPGVWIELAKKASSQKSVTYAEAVEVALCFGWIDGQGRGKDEHSWLQKFTPRRKRSSWSKINRERALALIASGEMRPAGLAEIRRAKQDGRWKAAYDSPKRSKVPEDLRRAFAKSARAREFFAELNATNRYAILYRIQTAKKPETRARRIVEFVKMLAQRKKLYF